MWFARPASLGVLTMYLGGQSPCRVNLTSWPVAWTSSTSKSMDAWFNPAGGVSVTGPKPLAVGGGDGCRRQPSEYAPATASPVETGGPSLPVLCPKTSLESAEEVDVYELYDLGFADGLISPTKEVVVYGLYDLALFDRAAVVGIVPINQGTPGGPRISRT